MLIDDAISMLKDAKKNGAKNVVIAWWESDCFQRQEGKDWHEICQYMDENMDWSLTHTAIEENITFFKRFEQTP